MTDYAKLITDLESRASSLRAIEYPTSNEEDTLPLLDRAIVALRELTVPQEGVSEGKIPYAAIVGLYNSTLNQTHLPPAKGLTAMRRRMIAQRWTEDKERRSLEWWAKYWKRIEASDFLAGRTPPTPGHENWRPNVDWFIKPGNMIKVLEGSYDNRATRTDTDAITRFR